MAKALNFKIAIEDDISTMSLEEVDKALDQSITEGFETDFSHSFGIEKTHIKEFQKRKEDYLTGKSKVTSWNSIKKQHSLFK